jgi:hypothetical protein
LIVAPNDLTGLRLIQVGIAFALLFSSVPINYLIERSELRARKSLLEVEYHVAELAEKVAQMEELCQP